MFPRALAFLAAVSLGALVCPQIAAAQEQSEETSPLTVVRLSSDPVSACDAGRSVVANFRYHGTKPLRGYLAVFTLADSTSGQVVQQQTVQEIRETRDTMITSGAEWTRTVCFPAKNIITDSATVPGARVDVLDFADGSVWGPAALRESHQLIGTLNGIDFKGKTATELQQYVTPLPQQHGPFPVASVETQTIGPLKIESGVWYDEHGREMFALDVTNESGTPIRGYVLGTTFLDPATGKWIRRFSTKELETRGNPADYLGPGATWVADPRKFSYLDDGTPAPYKVAVDLVVFADGSTFGPKKSAESDEVLGMFRGIDAANQSNHEVSARRDQ